jgi:hypothetical protein
MLDRSHLLLVVALLTSTAAACTKTEGQSSGSPTASTGTAAPASASAMPSAATAAPDASPMAADTTTGTMPTGGADATAPAAGSASGATSAATAKASTPAGSASAAPLDCGTKPLPDCPLQAWMKANTNTAIASNDLPALATALEKTAGFAPPGYTNWASISKDGAKAAKAGDMTAAKASCRTCHDQYKDKYKKEMRARKI